MGIKKIEKCVFCDDAGYDATYWWFEYGLENLIEESEHSLLALLTELLKN